MSFSISSLRRIGIGVLLFAGVTLQALAQTANRLEGITFTTGAGNKVELTLQLSDNAPTPPARSDLAAGVRPDVKRPREFLEQFPLDTMRMVGTLALQGRNYGLVQGKDGLVHRVLPGNFVGQNDGKIVGIAPTKISIIEIIPDGLGGYIERPAALALTE